MGGCNAEQSAGVSSELAHPATTPTGASQPGVGGARGGPAGRVQCRAAAVRGVAFFYMSTTERWQSCDQCASSSVAKNTSYCGCLYAPAQLSSPSTRNRGAGGQHGFFRHSAAIKTPVPSQFVEKETPRASIRALSCPLKRVTQPRQLSNHSNKRGALRESLCAQLSIAVAPA